MGYSRSGAYGNQQPRSTAIIVAVARLSVGKGAGPEGGIARVVARAVQVGISAGWACPETSTTGVRIPCGKACSTIVDRLVRQGADEAVSEQSIAAVRGKVNADIVTRLSVELHRQNGIERRRITQKIAVVRRSLGDAHTGNRHVFSRAYQVLRTIVLVIDVIHASVIDL